MLGPGVRHAVAAADEVEDGQVDPGCPPRQERDLGLLGVVTITAPPDSAVMPAYRGARSVTYSSTSSASAPQRPGEELGDAAIAGDLAAKDVGPVGVDLVPAAVRALSHARPEGAVEEVATASARAVAQDAVGPDPAELTHREGARQAAEDPRDQRAAAASRGSDEQALVTWSRCRPRACPLCCRPRRRAPSTVCEVKEIVSPGRVASCPSGTGSPKWGTDPATGLPRPELALG